MVIVVDNEEIDELPSGLSQFFQDYPSICEANEALTSIEHVNMWRDNVLFIKQRQQATSDYRENPKVRWIGSHAAMTCHIVVMRHRLTGVVSLGHFDNFCCWQFGENSSAHREGLDIMVEEMSTLSCGNADYIEVTVVGGYTDVRGDAERNSMALLSSLHEHWAEFYLKHFCVGKYNTVLNPESGLNEAILKGIAIDLQQQEMFPAVFSWGQYEDFKDQLKIKVLRLTCYSEGEIKEEERITADSTFKPKSLKNRKARQEVQSTAADKTDEVEIKSSLKRSSSIRRVTEEKKVAPAFKVKLRPLRPSLGHWGASTPSISGGGRKSKRSV